MRWKNLLEEICPICHRCFIISKKMVRAGTTSHEFIMIIVSSCSAHQSAAHAPDQSIQPRLFSNGLRKSITLK
ncbi:MAG: hypothetical protein WCJ37_15875 [Syntrophus sp. (in: bacteria)]